MHVLNDSTLQDNPFITESDVEDADHPYNLVDDDNYDFVDIL